MKPTKLIFSTVCIALLSFTAFSQNSIVFNGVTFGNCEVIEAELYNKSIVLKLSEIDLQEEKAQDGKPVPKTNYLSISLQILSPVKFPVQPEDSLIVRYSLAQHNLDEMNFEKQQLEQIDVNRATADGAQLDKKGEDLGAQARIISEQLMNGEITAQEAEAKLLALTNPLQNEIDNTKSIQVEIKDLKDRNTFDITYLDTRELTRSIIYAGYIYIKSFTKTEFEAVFKGDQYTECFERKYAGKPESVKKKCKQVTSKFHPEIKVLSNEATQGAISIKLKDFKDYRD